jgi:hypothetical protein
MSGGLIIAGLIGGCASEFALGRLKAMGVLAEERFFVLIGAGIINLLMAHRKAG